MVVPTTSNAGAAPEAAIVERPEWIDAKSVRRIFGISRTSLYYLYTAGKIKSVSIRARGAARGRRLYSYDSISNFLESRATGGEQVDAVEGGDE